MSNWTNPGIDDAAADKVRTHLQGRLVAIIDAQLTLKHIHWNVIGPNFIAIHEMLDEHVVSIREQGDELAERIATLGGVPVGTPGHVASTRTWDEYQLGRADGLRHLTALNAVYGGIIEDHRKVMDEIEEMDPVSHDMLVEHTSVLEQYQWFVRAFLTNAEGTLPE